MRICTTACYAALPESSIDQIPTTDFVGARTSGCAGTCKMAARHARGLIQLLGFPDPSALAQPPHGTICVCRDNPAAVLQPAATSCQTTPCPASALHVCKTVHEAPEAAECMRSTGMAVPHALPFNVSARLFPRTRRPRTHAASYCTTHGTQTGTLSLAECTTWRQVLGCWTSPDEQSSTPSSPPASQPRARASTLGQPLSARTPREGAMTGHIHTAPCRAAAPAHNFSH